MKNIQIFSTHYCVYNTFYHLIDIHIYIYHLYLYIYLYHPILLNINDHM